MITFKMDTILHTSKTGSKMLGIFLVLLFFSCTPTIQYLGDSYPSTNNIDVFYDEKDVERPYRTIGKMTHGNIFDHEVEVIKERMIEKAEENGADGIIFMDVKNIVDTDDFGDEDRLSITANLIRYKS